MARPLRQIVQEERYGEALLVLTVVYLLSEGPVTQVTFDPSLTYSSPGTTVEVASRGGPITALDVVAWAADPVGTKSLVVATAGSSEPYLLTTDIDGMVERVRNGKVVSVGAGIDLMAFPSNIERGLPTDATGPVSFVNRNAERVGDGLFVGPSLMVRMVPPPGPPVVLTDDRRSFRR